MRFHISLIVFLTSLFGISIESGPFVSILSAQGHINANYPPGALLVGGYTSSAQSDFKGTLSEHVDSMVRENNFVLFENDSTKLVAILETGKQTVWVYRQLFKYQGLYILCASDEPLCECTTATVIYDPETNEAQYVERPFSLSLVRNMLYRLKKLNRSVPFEVPKRNYEFCDLLKDMQAVGEKQ